MIKFKTMIPMITAFTLTTAAMHSCDTIRPAQQEKTELVNSPNQDTFETTGKTDKVFTWEFILGTLCSIGCICFLYYLKNPEEAKKHLFGPKEDNKDVNNRAN